MGSRAAVIVLTARDLASGKIRGVAGAVKTLGAVAAAVGVVQIGRMLASGMKAAIDAAGEQEARERELEQVIRSTGMAAGLTAEEVKKQASALQELTGIGDEVILKAQSLLLTFTNIGKEVFPEATETILNMSVALEQDLKSSTVQLGKALNDPIAGITALSRVGVSFTKQQKDTIRTLVESGQTMEAQRIILAELATEFGGQAAARLGTYQGRVEELTGRMGDFAEAVGGPVKDVLTAFLGTVLSPTIAEMVDGAKESDTFRNAILDIGIAIATVGERVEPAMRGIARLVTILALYQGQKIIRDLQLLGVTLDALGFRAKDSEGKFRAMREALENLKAGGEGPAEVERRLKAAADAASQFEEALAAAGAGSTVALEERAAKIRTVLDGLDEALARGDISTERFDYIRDALAKAAADLEKQGIDVGLDLGPPADVLAKRLEAERKFQESLLAVKLEAAEEWSRQAEAIELAALEAKYAREIEAAQKLGADTSSLEEALVLQKQELERTYEEARDAARAEKREARISAELDADAALRDARLAAAEEWSGAAEKLELEALDAKYAREIQAAEKLGIDTATLRDAWEEERLELETAYANERVKIAEEEAEAKRELQQAVTQQVFSTLGAVFGKSKGLAVAQAAMNTAQAVTKVLSQHGWPLGPILAALIAAQGLAQIRKIKSQKMEGYALGGIVRGPAGVDRVDIRATAGEGILSVPDTRDVLEGRAVLAAPDALGAGGLTINVTGDILDPEEFFRRRFREVARAMLLAEARNELEE